MIVKGFKGEISLDVTPPLSKSYAHRLIFACHLSSKDGGVYAQNIDTSVTYNALKALKCDGDVTIDMKESGSSIRFLLPYACTLNKRVTFVGDDSLKRRPIKELVDCLCQNGASIDGYTLPITTCGGLHSGVFNLRGDISSQYITGLLFALPLLDGDSNIVIKGELQSKPYIDMTLEVLDKCGVRVASLFDTDTTLFAVYGNQHFNLQSAKCERDWSSVAFILSAGALLGKAKIYGANMHSLQGDRVIIDILKEMGASVCCNVCDDKNCNESDGACNESDDENCIENDCKNGHVFVSVQKLTLHAIDVDVTNCIDLAPIIAVLMANANGVSRIKGISRLRLKESDRVASIKNMLDAFNVKCEVKDDEIVIIGGKIKAGKYLSRDHRMVMSAYVLALCADGESEIGDESCVDKSYPNFFEDMKGKGQN